jgi:nitrate/TMAO reductase-like tetraheme cytochrome c subunit
MSETPSRPQQKLPHLSYNPLSAVGATLALLAALTFLCLLGLSLYSDQPNPYFGIFMYMVLPPVLVLGLLLIPLGMWLRWRHFKRTGELAQRWPRIDLNQAHHRNAALIFVLGTFVVVAIMAVGSYGAYEYSESVQFCGTTCHQVMQPEYVTYQSSPHARVPCTSCHVGPGADWYVKSKMSGAYQVYATARHIYPTPIGTPIKNLRPAQETCEQCHWPEKIYGAQQRTLHHYKYDDPNTHWPIDMLIRTGGGDPLSGQAGIHWHMNIGVEVHYVARDEKRQEIPWVEVRDRRTGRVTVYESTEKPLTAKERATLPQRRMDCMDCHNRPSHTYLSPDRAIDNQLLRGEIDAGVPGIKAQAVAAMAGDYKTPEEALQKIATQITEYYRTKKPDVYKAQQVAIEKSIAGVQKAYNGNIFPLMKASWSSYPNNLGHFYSPGCMRCHDGKHTSKEGITVTRDCQACHVILAQGPKREQLIASGVPFEHPEDIGGVETEMGCYECHAGKQP